MQKAFQQKTETLSKSPLTHRIPCKVVSPQSFAPFRCAPLIVREDEGASKSL
jgi:hypothetical protein